MSKSNQLTHDQSEPKYGFVVISVILTFIVLIMIVAFSMIFYSISLSQDQDRKDRDYITSSFLDFHNAQEIELNRLEAEKNYIKLPIDLAKKAVLLDYSR